MPADTSTARKPPSEREHEVLTLVAEGLSNRLIGDRLNLSETTVKTHVANLLQDWGVGSRGALTWAALREGVLPCPCPRHALREGEVPRG